MARPLLISGAADEASAPVFVEKASTSALFEVEAAKQSQGLIGRRRGFTGWTSRRMAAV